MVFYRCNRRIFRKKYIIISFMIGSVIMRYFQWSTISHSANIIQYYIKTKPSTPVISFEQIRNTSEAFLTKQVLDDMMAAYTKSNFTENKCSLVPSGLVGPIKVELDITQIDLELLKTRNVKPGGHWKPASCKPYYKTAILVPYRNRTVHMKTFLHNMHLFMQKQMIEYQIYFVEQTFTSGFNRGMLFNIGFKIASETDDYDCYIMHDVDLLPEDDRNMYICSSKPRHMSSSIAKYKYELLYNTNFGGVCSMTKKELTLINGYSNAFFAWGGEDDEFYRRVKDKKLSITRYSQKISKYTGIEHDQSKGNDQRMNLLRYRHKRKNDGISSLKYTLIKKELLPFYTRLLVDIDIKDIAKQFPGVRL